jgi:hypothetical protein
VSAVAGAAVEKLNGLGYSKWGETIYVGESFGNGVNAYISSFAHIFSDEKGSALILNAADSVGYAIFFKPDYANGFKRSIAIQTADIADDQFFSVGHITIRYLNPDCGGKLCNIWGESHTSGIRFITCLFGGVDNDKGCGNIGNKPNIAKALIESRWEDLGLQYPNNNWLYDGCIDTAGNIYHPSCVFYASIIQQYDITPMDLLKALIVRPRDPNDKVGPPGLTEAQIVPPGSTLNYTINFENVATATAPVQELVIEDYLDPDLDWTTFQFGVIAYGDQLIPIPTAPGVLEFAMRDFPPSTAITGATQGDMAIDIEASVNIQTGRLEWRLKAIDTATDDFPEDPLAGFLPPEDGSGRGQGYVSFFIKPKADIPLGTQITNKASIVFDTNEAIETNEVWNTIDNPPPDGHKIFLPFITAMKTDGARNTVDYLPPARDFQQHIFLPIILRQPSTRQR